MSVEQGDGLKGCEGLSCAESGEETGVPVVDGLGGACAARTVHEDQDLLFLFLRIDVSSERWRSERDIVLFSC